ncbi:hypothetical protein [Thermocrinis minervae]|uniref:Uncharacterized protein n=1 Tax=Thermocrinis minervae TaxID=381751 RepID=A0A1M6Q0P7_9AQUI|nr:hypothetical protein [Thermocrinis minervae]SHK13778.1 hypothetical protein SAMN05444391_0030 [Thermocrinis minervae]
MKWFSTLMVIASLAYAQSAFIGKENTVGYIVVQDKGKVENYIVVEDQDNIKLIRVEKNPKEFLRKDMEGGAKK